MTPDLSREPETVAAFRSFEWKQGKQSFPQLKAEPGPVHAVRQYPGFMPRIRLEVKEPVYLDGRGDHERALCGASMRVLLPIKFNEQDPDACPACVEVLSKS